MARMHKTTIEVDLDALGEAEKNLGTKGFKETVNGALADVNRRAALKRAAEYVRAGRFHVPDEKTWAAWRAPRT
jgi:Arc/MetJ family transcription regulator